MNRPATIPELLFATAERGLGEYVFHLDDGIVRLSCSELAERATAVAGRLTALGVGPGDRVGVLGPNRPEWVVSAFAIWLAGAALVPLQVPIRIRDRGAFADLTGGVLAAAGARVVLAEPGLSGLLPNGSAVPWSLEGRDDSADPTPPSPKSDAVLQFTSGSTAAPKGARITHRAATAQMHVLEQMVLGPSGPRTMATWVPFFHDMGLFLCSLAPAVWGGTSHFLPTERFASDPVEWLRIAQVSRTALTLGPAAAFGSTIRAWERRRERIDLSALESALLVAEAVDPQVAQRVTRAAPDLALPPEALGSGYGLAEAVLAVAYSPAGSGLRFDRVSLPELAATGTAAPATTGRARCFASCGKPGMELRIESPGGEVIPERQIGQITLRGPSLMSGYVGADHPDAFADGWLRSGDLGYLADGELYVTGRLKDMVIAMGHNYYPEDFEWAAARVDGVRPGRCAAFNPPGTEDIVVLVEASEGERAEALRRRVERSIADAVGVAPSEVLVLPPGAVRKTTSGKLRRTAMRDDYASGALTPVGP